jgi:hypothetical protein
MACGGANAAAPYLANYPGGGRRMAFSLHPGGFQTAHDDVPLPRIRFEIENPESKQISANKNRGFEKKSLKKGVDGNGGPAYSLPHLNGLGCASSR